MSQANGCICEQTTSWKSLTFNVQSEFTALKEEFEETKIPKLNKYITKTEY